MSVLAVKRYSGDDETGSMARQHAALSQWIKQTGAAMADGPDGGWVSDETVSGSVNLDDRKSLGQWLSDPLLDRWDVMVVTTQDRVTRDDLHWWVFVGKLIDWGKRLVVLDDPGLDLSTPNGRMIAGVKAAQAANYRRDVQTKILRARESFREQRRWPGGHWPYGHRAVPRETGEGWVLVIDPVTSAHVQEATDRLIAGDSLRAIARDFNDRGIPTGRDHQTLTRPLNPGETRREPRGYTWNETGLKRVLQNPAVLGYATHNGAVIRQDGVPARWSDPIITADEYREVQEIIAGRGRGRRGIRSNRSPLLGVVYCGCGRPMRFLANNGRDGQRSYPYYRCSTSWTPQRCEHAVSWPYATVQEYVEAAFLAELGDVEITRVVFEPGENHDDEIRELTEAVEHLSGNLASLPAGGRAAGTVIAKISEHEARLDDLERSPGTPSSWRHEPTGETYGQRWAETDDWHERGRWLAQSGITVVFSGTRQAPEFHVTVMTDEVARRFPGYAG